MKTYVEEGRTVAYTNGGGTTLTSGSVVVIGGLLGILVGEVEAGATGVAHITGVHSVPKVTAAVIAAGEDVLWDVSAGAFDDNLAAIGAGDITGAAIAMEAAGSSITTLKIKLTPCRSTPAEALKLTAASAAAAYQPKFVAAPATAGAAGTAGQIALDGGYLYSCTATNTWVRVALATWT